MLKAISDNNDNNNIGEKKWLAKPQHIHEWVEKNETMNRRREIMGRYREC